MSGDRRLPRALVEAARDYVDGRRTPVEPRNAASVLLVRERAGLELFWLHRQGTMAFAPGMAVFPGGGVDPRDYDWERLSAGSWRGLRVAQWAERLGVEPALAGAVVLAAIRETFEECGVLFAEPLTGSWPSAAALEEARLSILGGEWEWVDFLNESRLAVRTDLLRPWGCWITPVFRPRRYRTWFFLAEVPPGQQPRHVTGEAVESVWETPAQALREEAAGRWSLMPPQYALCAELHAAGSLAQALAGAEMRDLAPITPTPRFVGEEALMEIPQELMELTDRVRAELALTEAHRHD